MTRTSDNVQAKPTVAERALAGLSQLKEALEAKEKIDKAFTVRTVYLNLEPQLYSGSEIRDLRERLYISQAVFAELLCVSVHTVRAWEQEKRDPPKMARRLFEQIESSPDRWLDWIRTMVEKRNTLFTMREHANA